MERKVEKGVKITEVEEVRVEGQREGGEHEFHHTLSAPTELQSKNRISLRSEVRGHRGQVLPVSSSIFTGC